MGCQGLSIEGGQGAVDAPLLDPSDRSRAPPFKLICRRKCDSTGCMCLAAHVCISQPHEGNLYRRRNCSRRSFTPPTTPPDLLLRTYQLHKIRPRPQSGAVGLARIPRSYQRIVFAFDITRLDLAAASPATQLPRARRNSFSQYATRGDHALAGLAGSHTLRPGIVVSYLHGQSR